jgi:RNA polymerase sigma-54 factor
MAFELRQELKLGQQLVMTPQLQLSIKLLQMCKLELVDVIQQEMTENPVLEEVPESEAAEGDEGIESIGAVADKDQEILKNAKDNLGSEWKDYIEGASRDNYTSYVAGEERDGFETTLTKSVSLVDHLMWQLHMNALPDEEQKIGEIIIGNVNQDGYLQVSLMEIAKIYLIEKEEQEGRTDSAKFSHVNWLKLMDALQKANRVLAKIHEFDPVGVASRNLEECLLIQSRFLQDERFLLERIIKKHFSDLEKKKYQIIASNLAVTIEEVVEAAKIISRLEPKPGRPFSDRETQYITPDIHVFKSEGEYVVVLNGDGLPKLRISPFYMQSIYNASSAAPVKEYIREKMRSAIWLIKSIYQRERTIRRVMESIIKFQREFFDHGFDHLKPLILKDVAEDIEMHESTISRVTTNKYVHTSRGIFELKYFFNAGIGSNGSEGVASETVKHRIKAILSGEDPKHPYSDQVIVGMLKEQDVTIARRTVAKYRETLGILPSSKRKNLY